MWSHVLLRVVGHKLGPNVRQESGMNPVKVLTNIRSSAATVFKPGGMPLRGDELTSK